MICFQLNLDEISKIFLMFYLPKQEVQKNLEKTKNDLDLLRSLETELEAFKVKHQQVVDELEKQMHDLMVCWKNCF